jgi:dolichyl-phosphate-mannose--protein O-mannosyl transferase
VRDLLLETNSGELTNSQTNLHTRFDEVHFGKFAARYIKTRYFVDVHPPLAKLLITFAAFVSGFNGSFDFGEIAK